MSTYFLDNNMKYEVVYFFYYLTLTFWQMFLRGVSGVVDKIKSIPNMTQEVVSELIGREVSEVSRMHRPFHFDADTIDLNIGVCVDMVSSHFSFSSSLCFFKNIPLSLID